MNSPATISQTARRALLLTLSLSAAMVLLALMLFVPAALAGAAPLEPLAGPSISMDSNVAASANSTVDMPVRFKSNGTSISSIIFSIDYDQNYLTFDPTLPNSITMSLPNGFVGGCTPNIVDPFAEINCFLYDPAPPLTALTDGVLATIRLRTKSAANGTNAVVAFSTTNPTSFGNTSGQAEAGNIQNGSVCIGGGCAGGIAKSLFLALVYKPLANVTVTVTPPTSQTPTLTPTATPTQPPAGCSTTLIQNSSFEPFGGYWYLPVTVKTAWFTNYRWRSPNYSVYTGIDPAIQPGVNLYSYSSARTNNNAPFVIPANATSATLRFYEYPLTTELLKKGKDGELLIGEEEKPLPAIPEIGKELELAPNAGDVQYVLVLDANDNVQAYPVWELSNARTWVQREVNLLPWAGSPIKLQWVTYNDGWYGVSAMYIDDAVLEVCVP